MPHVHAACAGQPASPAQLLSQTGLTSSCSCCGCSCPTPGMSPRASSSSTSWSANCSRPSTPMVRASTSGGALPAMPTAMSAHRQQRATKCQCAQQLPGASLEAALVAILCAARCADRGGQPAQAVHLVHRRCIWCTSGASGAQGAAACCKLAVSLQGPLESSVNGALAAKGPQVVALHPHPPSPAGWQLDIMKARCIAVLCC